VKTSTSIRALVELMEDSDPMVMSHAQAKLMEYGESIIPELEHIEQSSFDSPVLMENVAKILHKIRFSVIKKTLSNWVSTREKNLLEAVFTINQFQFSELDKDDFLLQFQQLKHDFWMKISPRQTCFERVKALNQVFYKSFGFNCLQKSFYSPFEVYTHSVFDTKEGNSLSLGLIYSIVAQSLDIPIYGVATMNRRAPFVLAYLDETNLLPYLDWGINNNGVLFYINIENKGEMVSPKQLREYYLMIGLQGNRSQFEPSPNSVIIRKYLEDIKRSYENQAYYRYKLDEINELISLFK